MENRVLITQELTQYFCLHPSSLRFSLADSTLPLYTTTTIFLREIIEELLWPLMGSQTPLALQESGEDLGWERF